MNVKIALESVHILAALLPPPPELSPPPPGSSSCFRVFFNLEKWKKIPWIIELLELWTFVKYGRLVQSLQYVCQNTLTSHRWSSKRVPCRFSRALMNCSSNTSLEMPAAPATWAGESLGAGAGAGAGAATAEGFRSGWRRGSSARWSSSREP